MDMYEKLPELKEGYTEIANMEGKHGEMLQDIGIYNLLAGKSRTLNDCAKETAILILTGTVYLEWDGKSKEISRSSVFEENPWCLHVSKGVNVTIKALTNSEILVQKTINEKLFDARIYTPEDCDSSITGEGIWNGTAERVIRTIFDYHNAPYSNLVIGEVISYPGRWSSYPPHHHDQPEVYYYRFDKPYGFGCAMDRSEAYRVEHHSYITIPGNLDHPQATAPGYAMYFCWMIRHLDNNPWIERVMEAEHKWLLKPDAKIWPEK
jgi:5-deoxy-glucuronate isomerase